MVRFVIGRLPVENLAEVALRVLVEHLEAASEKLKRLDDEAGPRLLGVFTSLASQRRVLQSADLEPVAQHITDTRQLITFAREQVLHSKTVNAAHIVQDIDAIDALLVGWLADVKADPTITMRRAGWRGVRAIASGEELIAKVRACLAAELEAVKAGRRPIARDAPQEKPKPGGKGGRPPSVHVVMRRVAELMSTEQLAPDETIRDAINAEFNSKHTLETLRRYWRNHKRHIQKQRPLAA